MKAHYWPLRSEPPVWVFIVVLVAYSSLALWLLLGCAAQPHPSTTGPTSTQGAEFVPAYLRGPHPPPAPCQPESLVDLMLPPCTAP